MRSLRLNELDDERKETLQVLAPLLRQVEQIESQVQIASKYDLANEGHWTNLVHVTNMGLNVERGIPLRETLLSLSERIKLLEDVSSSSAVQAKRKKEDRQSAWIQSLFKFHRVAQTTVRIPQEVRESGKRGQVLQELIESECRYVNDLGVLRGIHYAALLEQSKRTKPFISEDEVNLMFPECLKSLISVHEQFLSQLQQALQSPPESTCVGPLLMDLAHAALRPHSEYAICFSRSNSSLREWTSKRPALNAFLKDCRTHPQCCSRELIDFLIMPVQRILRYKLLTQELMQATPKEHPDSASLATAISAFQATGERVNSDKAKVEDFNEVVEFCQQLTGERGDFIRNLCTHPSQKVSGRRMLLQVKGIRQHGDTTSEKIRLILFSDLLLICSKKFRTDKLIVVDHLWLCDAAPVSLFEFRNEHCLLIESNTDSKSKPDSSRQPRLDFSVLVALLTLGDEEEPDLEPTKLSRLDKLERVRMEFNNAIACCVNGMVPSIDGIVEPPPPSPMVKQQNTNSMRMSTRRQTRGEIKLDPIETFADPVVQTPASPAAAAAATTSSPSTVSPAAATVVIDAPTTAVMTSPMLSRSKSNTVTAASSQQGGTSSPSASRSRTGTSSFMDKVGRTFRMKARDTTATKLFGVSLLKLWEAKPSAPQVVLDCINEIEARGATSEGVFRVPGSGDAVKVLKKQYDAGDPVDLASWDVNTCASLLSTWLRELPESLLSVASCSMFVNLMDDEEAFRNHLNSNLSKACLSVLSPLMLCCSVLAKNADSTKMNSENIALCLTPDLVRTEGSDAFSNLKTAASYGRVVKFMIDKAESLFERSSSSSSSGEQQQQLTVSTDESKKKVFGKKSKGKWNQKSAAGNSGNSSNSANAAAVPSRPKDLAFTKDEGNLGQVIAIMSHDAVVDDEISFAEGETIVIHQIHPSGWWYGSNDRGQRGIFPSSKTNAGGVVRPQASEVQTKKLQLKLSHQKSGSLTSPSPPASPTAASSSSSGLNGAASPRSSLPADGKGPSVPPKPKQLGGPPKPSKPSSFDDDASE